MTLRIGIIGSGFMARTHLDAYVGLEDTEVVALVSRNPERGTELAEQHSTHWTDDFEGTVASDEVDAIDICVPTPLHVEMAEAGLQAGKSVLLEKPIALDLEGANRILAAEEGADGVLMVALVLRFWPEYVRFLQVIESDEIGQLNAISAYRLSPPADWNDWMLSEDKSGGVPIDLMSHDFDQIIAAMGLPTEVVAHARSDRQHVFAQLSHDNGVSSVEGSMGMPGSYPFSCGFRAMGEQATVSYDFQVGAAVDGGNLGEAATVGGLQVAPVDGQLRVDEVDQHDPFEAELAYFVECARERRSPKLATGTQARDALAVALAVNRSLDSGRPEAVDT